MCAQRIDWIKATLESPAAPLFECWTSSGLAAARWIGFFHGAGKPPAPVPSPVYPPQAAHLTAAGTL